ncbi:hypothetical protein MNBD_GAMMA16-1927 [hydrothermal vent metagenome]|uniref:DUF748 domain-containing protein n=1 Tax=hydrothermal vent metagenome TaxID=652676 RepID=A0A3B0Z837_9ZZZZ
MSEDKKKIPNRLFGPRPFRSWRLWGLLFLLTYTLFGFIGAPYIIKSQLIAKTPEWLDRELAIHDVHVNPFLFSITMKGISLSDPDHVELVGLGKLHVNFDTFSLFRWAWTFSEISFSNPRLNLRIDESGAPSFADLIKTEDNNTPKKTEAVTQDTAMPRLVIQRFQVSGGQFNFEDNSIATPFKQLIDPINFSLIDFSTLPEREGPYRVYVKVPGEGEIRWQGDVSVNPLRSTGSLKLSALPLTAAWQYTQDNLKFSLDSGLLSGSLNYNFHMANTGPEFSASHIAMGLSEIEIRDKNHQKSDIKLPDIVLSDGHFDFRQQTLHIPEFAINGGDIDTFMDKEGRLHLPHLFTPITTDTVNNDPQTSQEVNAKTNDSAPWQLKLDRASINNLNLRFTDRTTTPHAKIHLTEIDIALTDITNQSDDQFGLQASLKLNDEGLLNISGKVAALEPMADLMLDLTQIPLVDFQAYLNPTTNMGLLSGYAALQSKFLYKESAKDADITLSGQLKITNFSAKNNLTRGKVISWKSLDLDGINLELSPDKLDINTVSLNQLNSRVIIARNGDINVESLAKEDTSTPASTKKTEETADPFPISIKSVHLKNSVVSFVDNTVKPRFSSRFNQVNGVIKGLSSENFARADVDISGRVDDHSTLSITGQINPLSESLYTDLKLKFSNYSMASLTPYTGRYIGNAIDKGRMSFELNYQISNEELKGENKVLLDQLALGRKIKSADAVSLPIALAIALLKDTKGIIDLDVPVKGNLDDPEFRLSGLIFKALGNVIAKIATSPFKMLAKLAGGGDEMDKVVFIPGGLVLLPEHNKRLNTLGKALQERPQLLLEVRGQYDEKHDKPILQKQKLVARLNASNTLPSTDTPLNTLDIAILETNYSAQAGAEAMTLLKTKHTTTNEETKEKEPEIIDPTLYKAAVVDSLIRLETVNNSELRDLARSRADTIRNHFVNTGGLNANRIFVLEAAADKSATKEGISALFTLTAK